MVTEQLYTSCLAQAAYYIESNGEAAIIDPMRDISQYIEMAKERGAKIKYIFETHFHADFVSGHVELAKASGATIVYGPTAKVEFNAHIGTDGERFKIGDIEIELLHTPGHTPESSCFLLHNADGKPHSIYTGDTVFVGDVGRPDLLDGVMSKEDLAGMMFESLHTKIIPLSDDIILYPGHGPGSACGKNIGKETWSTVGEQKKNNYALQPMSKDDFIKTLTDGISPAPAYFFEDARLNKKGAPDLNELITIGARPLTADQFAEASKNGQTILDTRKPDAFETGFIPGSINIGLNGQFAVWAATLLPLNEPLILVADPGTEKEAITRLARVGFNNISGYLDGGYEAWNSAGKRYDMIITIDPEEFALDVKHSDAKVLDVRKPGEYNDGHVVGAIHQSLDQINSTYDQLNKEEEYLVHCAGGYRSMIAASILKSKGFQCIKNVSGGYAKIKETDLALEKNNSI